MHDVSRRDVVPRLAAQRIRGARMRSDRSVSVSIEKTQKSPATHREHRDNPLNRGHMAPDAVDCAMETGPAIRNRAPRCGARRRDGGACRAPAIRGNRRCRLHGGLSTGPKTLEGLAHIRAANTRHGRFSAEGQAVARWARGYVRNGRRSLRALAKHSPDARARLSRLLLGGDTPPPTWREEQRVQARANVRAHDIERLHRKGFL